MSTPDEKLAGDGYPVSTSVKDVEKDLSDTGPPSPSSLTIDPKAEARLVRKLDFTIFPILYILYMLSFLDRINISNARIQGLATELGMTTNNHFNIALFVSFLSPTSTHQNFPT